MPDIDLDYLAKQNAQILEEIRALKAQMEEMKASVGQTLDIERRTDPRRPSGLRR